SRSATSRSKGRPAPSRRTPASSTSGGAPSSSMAWTCPAIMAGCRRFTASASWRTRCGRGGPPGRVPRPTGAPRARGGRARGRRMTGRSMGRRPVVAGLAVVVGLGLLALGAWVLQPGRASGQAARAPEAGRPHPGQPVYERNCALCHGPTGQADGPAAAALPIKPPPLTARRVLNGLTDDFLVQIVRDGAGSVGLAPQMPAFGRQLTEKEIRDVVAYVRTMAQPPYRPRAVTSVTLQAPAPAQPIEFSHAVHAG